MSVAEQEQADVIAFLAGRMVAQQNLTSPRCWGVSADALALYGVGAGPRPQVPGRPDSPGSWRGDECGSRYPSDHGDLLACQVTYVMAPKEVRERMLPVLEEFEAYVRRGLNRYGEPLR